MRGSELTKEMQFRDLKHFQCLTEMQPKASKVVLAAEFPERQICHFTTSLKKIGWFQCFSNLHFRNDAIVA